MCQVPSAGAKKWEVEEVSNEIVPKLKTLEKARGVSKVLMDSHPQLQSRRRQQLVDNNIESSMTPVTLDTNSIMSSLQQCDVVLVCCGAPLRGMGWYHSVQLLSGKCPSAKLIAVVEPFFLGNNTNAKESPFYESFKSFEASVNTTHPDVKFVASIHDLNMKPSPTSPPLLVIISGRTPDNPTLTLEVMHHLSPKAIYLEKPGAPSLEILDSVRRESVSSNIPIFMGFNKNVSSYVNDAMTFIQKHDNPGALTLTFASNNEYAPSDASLGECFERNSEGLLKNMAIHEVALLTSFFDVSPSTIDKIIVDTNFTCVKTLKGTDGVLRTDMEKVRVSLVSKNVVAGRPGCVGLSANRCGGNSDSWASITNTATGDEIARFNMVSEEGIPQLRELEAKYPGAMPYFLSQDKDYITLKESIAQFVLGTNSQTVQGVVDISIAIETMRVAEYLKEVVESEMKK